MKTMHLMTQDGQPYGSSRRCCEICGLMMVCRPDVFWHDHAWTEDREAYESLKGKPEEFKPCLLSSKQ